MFKNGTYHYMFKLTISKSNKPYDFNGQTVNSYGKKAYFQDYRKGLGVRQTFIIAKAFATNGLYRVYMSYIIKN